MLTEKQVKEKLIALFGKDVVFLTTKNAYGDRRKYAFGFWIKPIAQRYKATDNAPAGYSNQYNIDIGAKLDDELRANGFNSHNVYILSYVHGWIHRVIK